MRLIDLTHEAQDVQLGSAHFVFNDAEGSNTEVGPHFHVAVVQVVVLSLGVPSKSLGAFTPSTIYNGALVVRIADVEANFWTFPTLQVLDEIFSQCSPLRLRTVVKLTLLFKPNSNTMAIASWNKFNTLLLDLQ